MVQGYLGANLANRTPVREGPERLLSFERTSTIDSCLAVSPKPIVTLLRSRISRAAPNTPSNHAKSAARPPLDAFVRHRLSSTASSPISRSLKLREHRLQF